MSCECSRSSPITTSTSARKSETCCSSATKPTPSVHAHPLIRRPEWRSAGCASSRLATPSASLETRCLYRATSSWAEAWPYQKASGVASSVLRSMSSGQPTLVAATAPGKPTCPFDTSSSTRTGTPPALDA
eukprot:scaffold11310_cov107-Isochrysis_galbana.AAC.4